MSVDTTVEGVCGTVEEVLARIATSEEMSRLGSVHGVMAVIYLLHDLLWRGECPMRQCGNGFVWGLEGLTLHQEEEIIARTRPVDWWRDGGRVVFIWYIRDVPGQREAMAKRRRWLMAHPPPAGALAKGEGFRWLSEPLRALPPD
jgi:hypothetical protein